MEYINKLNINGSEYHFKDENAITIVDSELSLTSENPVQNKVIVQELNSIKAMIGSLKTENLGLSTQIESLSNRLQILENNQADDDYIIIITEQPVSPGTVYLGNTFNLSVDAISSYALSYQWQYYNTETSTWVSPNNPTATTKNFTSEEITKVATYNWRCKISNSNNEIYTSVVQVIQEDPSITIVTQPANATVKQGHSWSMNVDATSTLPLTYTWMQRQSDSSSWAEFPSDKNGSPMISAVMADDAVVGTIFQIKCKIVNDLREVETNVVTLTVEVDDTITITTQPVSTLAVPGGETFTLSVEASSKVNIAYLWQTSEDEGATWKTAGSVNASGTNPTYTGVMDYTMVKDESVMYRCQMTSGTNVAYSNVSTVVCSKTLTISITQQPAAQSIILGDSVALTVETDREQDDVSYAWSRLNKAGTLWQPCGETKTITLTPISTWGAPVKVKCKVMIQGTTISAESNEAIITIADPAINITEQPVSPGTVYYGETYSLSVEAESELPLSYQWQIKEQGTTEWTNNINSTATTNTFVSEAVSSSGTFERRCKIWNSKTTVYSDVVTVTQVNQAINITTQPVSTLSVETGDTIQLSVVANSEMPLSYQWFEDRTGTTSYDSISGATSPTLSITAPSSATTKKYFCVITNRKKRVDSNTCTVSVKAKTPASVSVTSFSPRSVSWGYGKQHNFSVEISPAINGTIYWGFNYSGSTNGNSLTYCDIFNGKGTLEMGFPYGGKTYYLYNSQADSRRSCFKIAGTSTNIPITGNNIEITVSS